MAIALLLIVVGCSLDQQLDEGLSEGDNLVKNAAEYQQPSHYPPDRANYIVAAQWLAAHSPADAVIICDFPYDFYWWSGRRTLVYQTVDGVVTPLQAGDYVAVDAGALAAPDPLGRYIAAHPQQLQLIYETQAGDAARIYKVVK